MDINTKGRTEHFALPLELADYKAVGDIRGKSCPVVERS